MLDLLLKEPRTRVLYQPFKFEANSHSKPPYVLARRSSRAYSSCANWCRGRILIAAHTTRTQHEKQYPLNQCPSHSSCFGLDVPVKLPIAVFSRLDDSPLFGPVHISICVGTIFERNSGDH